MGKSQESFNKKEKEKKRRKKKQEKMERREQRKAEKAEAGTKTFEDMISYVDEDGNLSSTPPDPSKKRKIKAEDIEIGIPPKVHVPIDPNRKGKVKFFNDEKGYGFITDSETQESVFVHINNAADQLRENDKVLFQVEMGPKGPNAVNVRIAPVEPKIPVRPPKVEETPKDAPVVEAPENTDDISEKNGSDETEVQAETEPAGESEIKENA